MSPDQGPAGRGDGFLSQGFRRLGYAKNVDRLLEEAHSKGGLKKSLGSRDLITLGVAGIIGAGIFVLIGQGIEKAGAWVILGFLVAALICAFAGYAYAELAACIPASGSAYAYLYTALGELPGWLVAWALVLEYAVGAIAVAIGWRNNFLALVKQVMKSSGANVDSLFNNQTWYGLTHSPFESAKNLVIENGHVAVKDLTGFIDLPAIAIVLLCTGLLILGTKESARFTAVLVTIKVAILLLAIGIGFYLFKADNLLHATPAPGVAGFVGIVKGVFAAGAIMFFAYIGFDSVSTTAEETKNPKRDLPIGILGSLAITTVLYMLAAVALIGAAPTSLFLGDSQTAQDARGEPYGYVFEQNGIGWGAILVRIGALIGTTSVLLVLILGGVRVFFNMSRDGLLPAWMSKVSKRGAPAATTVLYGLLTMAFAGFLTLGFAVELVNIGTLFAFLMVILAAWIFRLRRPDVERPFKMPMWSPINRNGRPYLPIFVILGILGTLALIVSLDALTLVAALTWTGIGLLVYAFYGIRHSREAASRHGQGAFGNGTAPDSGDDGADARKARAAPATRAVTVTGDAPEAARVASGAGARGAYTHNGYTLYRRQTDGRSLYFFAKNPPASAEPSRLPAGYEVGANSKTGLPYLKRAA